MNTAMLEVPTGQALKREIENVEAQAHDEQIRKTIADRIEIANSDAAVFVPHDTVFSESRARLLAKLTPNA